MRTRTLSINDTDALYRFYTGLSDEVRTLFQPFPEITEALLHRHLEESDRGIHLSLGLIDGSQIAGHAFVTRIADANPVFGIGLDAAYHGKGYGKRLAQEILKRCDATGIRNITLTVLKHNEKAVRMYERLGFQQRGNHTFREKDDSYLMIRHAILPQTEQAP